MAPMVVANGPVSKNARCRHDWFRPARACFLRQLETGRHTLGVGGNGFCQLGNGPGPAATSPLRWDESRLVAVQCGNGTRWLCGGMALSGVGQWDGSEWAPHGDGFAFSDAGLPGNKFCAVPTINPLGRMVETSKGDCGDRLCMLSSPAVQCPFPASSSCPIQRPGETSPDECHCCALDSGI